MVFSGGSPGLGLEFVYGEGIDTRQVAITLIVYMTVSINPFIDAGCGAD